MKKQEQSIVIDEIQQDPNKIIISNPLAILKFNKQDGRDFVPVSIQEIGVFVPKIVWETVSLLSNTDIESIEGKTITKRIYIRDFIKRIRGDEKKYKYVIDAARALRFWEIASVNDKGQEVYRGFFNEVIHDKRTGYIDLEISKVWARELLDIAKNGNVSFLKQYLFDLQNSHAINLYPTLKAHVYKGKYVEELDGFKIRFGYNTKGYKIFSNLKTYVIEPAIEELNKKSDLIVYFEPEGTNLDGQRPRVTGVIFWVKEKPKEKPQSKPQPQEEPSHISNKIKDVPFVIQDEPKQEPRKEQPKPQSITTPPPTGASVPSDADIQQLADKLKLNPEQVQAIKNKLDNNSIRVFEVLQGCINEIKAGNPIKSNIAYILGSIDTLGLGIYALKQDKLHKEQEKQIRENAQQQEQKQIKKIINGYNLQSDKDFLRAFEELNEEQQAHYQRFIAKKLPYAVTHYYTNNELNEQGKALAGQYDIFGESYDRDNEILKYARSQGISLKKDINKETKFALDGLITVETLTAEPQPQSIEATPPTAPSMATAPLPQVSEVVEPSEPPHEEQDESKKSRKQLGNLSSKDIEEMKNVEAPKSFGDLFKNLFR
jgi:hypothetical protein